MSDFSVTGIKTMNTNNCILWSFSIKVEHCIYFTKIQLIDELFLQVLTRRVYNGRITELRCLDLGSACEV